VTEFNPDGSIVDTFPVGKTPLGIAFDGTHMWAANHDSNNVTELSAT
jgi:DNA-binding beta-propeller fold protein YncE